VLEEQPRETWLLSEETQDPSKIAHKRVGHRVITLDDNRLDGVRQALEERL
jgi:hypothetical protein